MNTLIFSFVSSSKPRKQFHNRLKKMKVKSTIHEEKKINKS